MQKQPAHQEWARLKLIGRPLLSAIASGPTPLLWVALRPSPCLLHLYRDAELQGIFRFPSDPIFLLLGPPQNHPEVASRVNSENDCRSSASLMVITCDGHIWCLPVFDNNAISQRPAERCKYFSKEPEKACSGMEPLNSQLGVEKENSKELDLLDLLDASQSDSSPELFPALRSGKESSIPSKEQSEMHLATSSGNKHDRGLKSVSAYTVVSDRLSHMYLHLKRVAVHISKGSPEKKVRCVQKEALIGVFSDARLAAFGFRNVVAVVSPSRNPKFFQHLLQAPCLDAHISLESHNIHSSNKRTPTCMLFVSAIGDYGHERSYWNGALVSETFFEKLSKGLVISSPDQLLLQGDTKGQVLVFPVCDAEQSCSYIFCDIQEPVFALFAVPYHKSSDMLMIIGRYGRIVAVAPSRVDALGNPFLASHSDGGSSRLFQVELSNGFQIRDWSTGLCIISVCLADYGRLCVCLSSEVYIVDLFEGTTSDMQKLYDNYCYLSTKEDTSEPLLKNSLQFRSLPVAEVIIIVGKGLPVSRTSTRNAVALTARGQLLGLEISEHVLAAKGMKMTVIKGKHRGTWKSEAVKMDEHVKDLINQVEMTECHIKNIKQSIDSVNLALSELGSSLIMTKELLQNQPPGSIRKPDLSSAMPPLTGFWCKLEIIPPPMVLAPEQLSFKLGSKSRCVEAFNNTMQHIDLGIDVRFLVTLFNFTAHSLSSHWSIILELRTINKARSPVFNFSSIINGRYGLPFGNQCSIEFCGVIPGVSQSPWIASVFLCHVHDQHKVINNTDIYHLSDVMLEKELNFHEGILCKPVGLMDTFGREKCHDSLHVTVSSSMKGANIPGAVCVLLARFRVDVLSLLRPPLQKVRCFPEVKCKHDSGVSGPVPNESDAVGPINIRFQLSNPGNENNIDNERLGVLHKWKELSLEDLLGKCTLSENGSQITACVPGAGIMSLTLEHRKDSNEGAIMKELVLSSSSLPLGCFVREALLWRLAFSQNNLLTNFEWRRSSGIVMQTIEKLGIIINHADSVRKLGHEMLFGDAAQRTDHGKVAFLVQQSFAIIEDLFRAYMNYRENRASGPF